MPSPPRYFAVHLPCKAYIKKYAQSIYGEIIPAHSYSTIGCFVNATLEKERYTMRHYSASFIHKYYTDKLTFYINAFQFARIGFDFPNCKVIELNKFLEAKFEEHLHQWVDARHIEGKTERQKLIGQFAERHGIRLEYDISLEALVKSERRLRSKIQKNMEIAQQQLSLMVAA